MRACLTSRIASRILMRLGSSDYYDEEDIYNFACRTKWENHFGPDKSIRVDINAHRSPLRSLDFTLLRIKDGICDRFNHFMKTRPNVDRARPDIRIFAYVDEHYCTFYLDLCGEALFKRGWRRDKGEAPLKENLAAGLLMLAGWTPEIPLVDPFCGSGTIAIEASSIATNTAPGLNRHFLFENFSDFDRELWQEIKDDAKMAVNRYAKVQIQASDISAIVVEKAIANTQQAGFGYMIEAGGMTFCRQDAREVKPNASDRSSHRQSPLRRTVKSQERLRGFHDEGRCRQSQAFLRRLDCIVLTSDRQLPRQMRLSEKRKIPLFNGPLECRFFKFELVSGELPQR